MLPHLWDAAGDTHLMKQSILTILSRIVTALKAESVPLYVQQYHSQRIICQQGANHISDILSLRP